MMTRRSPDFWVSLGACLVLPACLVLGTWAEPNAWFSSDIAVKMLQVEGCVAGDCVIPYHAAVEDPEQRFRPIQYPFAEPHEGGKGYESIYGNLLVHGATFFHSIFGPAGTLVIPLCSFLILLAGSVGIGQILGLASSWSLLGAGLMTSAWFYAAVFWEHLPAVAALLWMVLFVLHLLGPEKMGRATAPPGRWVILAAALVGALSVAFRPESALAVGAFGGFAWVEARGRTRILLMVVGGLIFSTLGIVFLLEPRILPVAQLTHNITDHGFDFLVWLRQRMDHAVNVLAGVYEQGYSHQDKGSYFLSASVAMAWLALVLFGAGRNTSWTPPLWLRFLPALVAVALPILFMDSTGLAQPLGLLVVSPILFFLPVRTQEPRKRVLIGGSLAFVFLCLLTMPNEGGLQIGARYLLPVAPILALLALASLSEISSQGSKAGVAITRAVVVLTLLAQGIAFAHLLAVDQEKDETVAQIRAMPADAYATTDGFLACELTALVWPRPVYFVPDPSQPASLVDVMRRRGVRDLVMIGDLPSNPPAGFVDFGPYRLKSILPTPWYPLPHKAAWQFGIPQP